MSAITPIATPMTTATQQLTSPGYPEVCFSGKERQLQHLRMNWIVVSDDQGKRRLQTDWRAGRNH